MFEGDSADKCAGKFPLVSMGGSVEGLACADPGTRTPIGASGNFHIPYDSVFWLDKMVRELVSQDHTFSHVWVRGQRMKEGEGE